MQVMVRSARVVLVVVMACGGSTRPELPANPAPAPAPPPAPTAGDLAITNVTVVPMSQAGVLAHYTVVVRGGRIAAVAPSASITLAPGMMTIDGTNKWLMPGLADMHVHTYAESDLALFLAAGVTTVRNMFGSEMHLALRGKIARGELQGPTIVTAGPIIDGNPPVWPGSTVLENPADAERIVTEQKAAGYDFLKPYGRLSRPAYEALAAAGAKHGMLLEGHVPTAVGLEGVLAAKQRTIEHLDGWVVPLLPDPVPPPGTTPPAAPAGPVSPAFDPAKLPGLIARTIAAGTWNCPTLIVMDRFGALEDPAALIRRTAWIAEIPPAFVAAWDPKQGWMKGFTAQQFAAIRAANASRAQVLAALAAANAPILVGTDTGNPFVIPGEAMHEEIELMVAAGMPRAQVLRAATAQAAVFLGTPHDFGVVEVGARADLVLASVNPLVDALPLVPDGVMVRGAWLTRAVLDAKLAEIAKLAKLAKIVEPPKLSWDGVPPLAARGRDVRTPGYDRTANGTLAAKERAAIGVIAPGKRAIVGQMIANYGVQIATSYTLLPDATTLGVTSPRGTFELAGRRAAGKLVVTGNDVMTGKPVSLSAAFPAGAFLSGPGVGSALALADQLTGMKVGELRTRTSLAIAYYPEAAIASTDYRIERKPDAGDHRVFAVTSTTGALVSSSTLELDRDGVVAWTIGAPLNTTFSRVP